MSRILEALAAHAATSPRTLALLGEGESLDFAGLQDAVQSLAERLRRAAPRVVGLLAENGVDWAVADLAALAAGIPCVPLPTFFSPAQRDHALRAAGIDLLLTDRPAAIAPAARKGAPTPLYGSLWAVPLAATPVRLPKGTVKITFTSGTTGTPKGVCLGREAIETVSASLRDASEAGPTDRHLALLPLSTLLENIAGLYVPLLAGASTCLWPGERVGLQGSAGVSPAALLAALGESRATTAILVPQLLQALVAAFGGGAPRPDDLRYLAVGGAPVSPRLLRLATDLGLPVFEGYGLSECASVVAVNRPGDARQGSVGRPLPHARVEIGPGGAIRVQGAGFLGYLGEASRALSDWVYTGDVGYLDGDGRLVITGRRKNMFITAFGRNVAPEWVEREIVLQVAVAQVAVFGEGRPFNVAVVVPRAGATDADVAVALAIANRQLPDYARVTEWVRAAAPFSSANGQLTTNGRVRRQVIADAYASPIERCYQKEAYGLLY